MALKLDAELDPCLSILRAGDLFGSLTVDTQDLHFEDRTHLLVEVVEQSWEGPTPCIIGKQMIQMGANSQQTIAGVFPPGPDMPVSDANIKIMWERHDAMPTYTGKILIRNIHDLFPSKYADSSWAIDQFTHLRPLRNRTDATVRYLEMFSGGYGGWSYAARFLKDDYKVPLQTVSVECCWEAAINFASTHGAVLVDGTSDDFQASRLEDMRDCVLCANVVDCKWQGKVSHWRPDLETISSPCQKWSAGAYGNGLASESGRLMAESILILRKFRPKVAMLEQVRGFPAHKHWKMILSQLRAAGYNVLWAKVLNAKHYGAAHRPCWLCLAILRHEPMVKMTQFVPWAASCTMSPDDMDSVVAWPKSYMDALKIPKAALDLASKACFLPREKRAPYIQDGKHVLQPRCFSEKEIQPVVMAKYGYQHELDEGLLRQKGYFASFFVKGSEPPRFLHPVELALIHTTWDCYFTSSFLGEAWEQIGNLITMPHGLLMPANAICQLTKTDPVPVQETQQHMWESRLKASSLVFKTWSDGIAIMKEDDGRFDGNFCFHYQQARQLIKQCAFPKEYAWNRESGFQPLAIQIPTRIGTIQEDIPEDDQVSATWSQMTVVDEPSQTQYFPTMQNATLRANTDYSFWFEGKIPLTDLECVWDHRFKPSIIPASEVTSLHSAIQLKYDDSFEHHAPSRPLAVYVHDQHVNVYGLSRGTNLKHAIGEWSLPADIYDQYGEILENQKASGCSLLLRKEALNLTHKPAVHPAFVLAAFPCLTSHGSFWDPDDQSFCIHGTGPYAAVATIANMWADVLPKEILKELSLSSLAEIKDGSSEFGFEVATQHALFHPMVSGVSFPTG
eukprot:Skav221255  [mRNA]  locus=scaffold1045:757136:759676:+ [translate_table: standard]